MKKFIALALVTVGVTVSARAQWIVFDPTMNVQSILNTAQEIAKYVEMINNQCSKSKRSPTSSTRSNTTRTCLAIQGQSFFLRSSHSSTI